MIKLERQSTHTSYNMICQFYLFGKRSVFCSVIVMQISFFSYCFDILTYDDINVTRSNSPSNTIILHIYGLTWKMSINLLSTKRLVLCFRYHFNIPKSAIHNI